MVALGYSSLFISFFMLPHTKLFYLTKPYGKPLIDLHTIIVPLCMAQYTVLAAAEFFLCTLIGYSSLQSVVWWSELYFGTQQVDRLLNKFSESAWSLHTKSEERSYIKF